jgi:hypothetical protein
MPPLRRVAIDFDEHDDDNDEGGVFFPLDRRWSDASELSAYSMHPDDQALRVHPHRLLENKKVAVVGCNASGILCASVLRQDGHDVIVLNGDNSNKTSSSIDDTCSTPQHIHPDFLVEAHHTTQQQYNEECAETFGVTVRQDMTVVEMTEKYGGWVLTMKSSNGKQPQLFEYFDFVVIADEPCQESASSYGCARFYHQFLFPIFLCIVAFLCNFANKQQERVDDDTGTSPVYLPAEYKSTPRLYRRMICRDIPSVAFVGHQSSTTYLASIWLSTMLHGEMTLPEPREMVTKTRQWSPVYHLNGMLLQDLGLNPKRKQTFWEEIFGASTHNNYCGLLDEIQQRRRISAQEGWAVPLTPVA